MRTDGAYDAVIIGAGLVGMALAVAVRRAGFTVAVVDRANVAATEPGGADEDWDPRVYAVSPGSADFLRALGAWQRLPAERICAIETMGVAGDAGGELTFSAYEIGERALAWVVENRALNAALVETLRTTDAIDVYAPVEPLRISWQPESAELEFADGRRLSARLVVGADGVRSWTRAMAGIAQQPRAYEQTAIVANFNTTKSHRGRALQWFLPDEGVLAWLPLPGRRISIVWSAPHALARELLALSADALAVRVGAAGSHALGDLALITSPAAFPLSFLRLPTPVAQRLALVGDAAHGVHPLAGQGVNLGFGDAATLAAVLGERGAIADPGASALLERYARKRAEPVWAMQTMTDGLARLFATRLPWAKQLRNTGMNWVDALPLVRRMLTKPALR